MSKNREFRFSVPNLPEGNAMTGSEVERMLLEQLNDGVSDPIETLWSLARLYSMERSFDRSTACLLELTRRVDDAERRGACFLALGQLQEQRRDYPAAIECYRAALAFEPCAQHVWYLIHNNLGFSLNQVGKSKAAVPYLKTARKIDPTRPNAYKNLGLSYQALGDLKRAAELFVEATQVRASDPRSFRHLVEMVEAHPELLSELPELESQIEDCRVAVGLACGLQPDLEAHWKKLRKAQKKKVQGAGGVRREGKARKVRKPGGAE